MDIKKLINRTMGPRSKVEKIKETIDELGDELERMQKKLEGFNKDETIVVLRKEIRDIRRSAVTILNEEEIESRKQFSKKHYNSCKSSIRIIVEGNGIGDSVELECKKCGERLDITDYKCW